MLKRISRAVTILTLTLALLPVLLLVVEGARHFPQAIVATGALRALGTSAGSGAVAMFIIFVTGIPTAFVLRTAPHKVRRLAGVVLVLALLMPPLVLGLVLAYILAPATWIGGALASWHAASNSFFALVLAEVYEALPYFVLTVWSAVTVIPRSWEEDAWALHKTPWETFRFVLWPAATPGLVTATAMAWARIVGAFGAPVVVAYHPTALPVQIWITLEETGLPQALSLALWLVILGLPLPGILTWRQGGPK
jgi:molybdate/tungstate transport system permease protein